MFKKFRDRLHGMGEEMRHFRRDMETPRGKKKTQKSNLELEKYHVKVWKILEKYRQLKF